MKDFIKNILRENLQQADKLYFNNGKISPENRDVIIGITNGDVYTKLVSDLSFSYMRGGELSQHIITLLKTFHTNLKNYDKNRLPIKGKLFDYGVGNDGGWDIFELNSFLNWRQKAIDEITKLPSVVVRNIKEIKRPITNRYDMEEIAKNLKILSNAIGQLEDYGKNKDELIGKIASSKETLESMIEITRHFYNSFLQIEETDIEEVLYEIGQQNAVLKQNKNNILVVKIKDEEAAQALSCGTTWCFARPNSTDFWEEYAQMGYLYYIYDFNKEITDAFFLMTYIPTTGEVYAGTNVSIEELGVDYGFGYLKEIGVNTKIFDKDYERANKPKKEKIKGDPNQLSLDLHERKLYFKRLLNNYFGN